MEKYFGPKFVFVEVEVSSHQKGLSLTEVEMLSTAFFKSRYDVMTAENNRKSRALSSVNCYLYYFISISAD